MTGFDKLERLLSAGILTTVKLVVRKNNDGTERNGVRDSLPAVIETVEPDPISPGAGPNSGRKSIRAIGTDAHHPLAPPLSRTWCKPRASEAHADKTKAEPPISIGPARLAGNPCVSGEIAGFQGLNEWGFIVETKGIEPSTSWLQTRRSPN